MEAVLDQFGRIVIPKRVRLDFHLRVGERLEIEEVDEGILLKPLRKEGHLLEKDGVLVFSGDFGADASDWIKNAREERSHRFFS